MKKIISVFLAVTLVLGTVFALSGCKKGENAKFDIVLITDGNTFTDKNYNQYTWKGIESYAKDNDLSCRYYQPALNGEGKLDIDTIEKYIELSVNNGAQFIVLPGDNFSVAAYEIAPRFKDVKFILVDAFPHSADNNAQRFQSNVECITFDALQAGFLAGYSSVIDGFNKLGYIGCVNSSNSGNYGAGFVQGAAYAADETGTPVIMDYADLDTPILNFDYSVSIKPVYKKVSEAKEKTFKVEVVDGYGSGVYTDGENVNIYAKPAQEGKAFDHWDVKSNTEGVKDKKVNISSKSKQSMNLLVGDCDCTITAVWKDVETVPVTIMEADGKTVFNTVYAEKNSSCDVQAPSPEIGMTFDRWDTDNEEVISKTEGSYAKISVKEEAITLTPVYTVSKNPTFIVSVENGTGSGIYSAGDKVNIVADAPANGEMFVKWENTDKQGLSSGIAMDNEYCYNTSFEMVDRYSSIAKSMFNDGKQIIFAGGNPKFDSVFSATKNYDYSVYAFGSGVDQSGLGNCYASVVTDYGEAVKQVLGDFKGGASIFVGNCANNCIYVTGKSLNPTYTDSKGNEIDDEAYNEKYADVYSKLAENKIPTIQVQSGGDVRESFSSKCLSLNYWIIEE